MAQHIGFDRALALLAHNNGADYAVRRNGDAYDVVRIDGGLHATISAITFDALYHNGAIKLAPAYNSDAGIVYVHRSHTPAALLSDAERVKLNAAIVACDDPSEYERLVQIEADDDRAREAAGIDPHKIDIADPRFDAAFAADDIGMTRTAERFAEEAYDTAHAPVNAAATASAEARFDEIADDVIPHVETVAMQTAIAQIARALRLDRASLDEYALALYRIIDRTPDSEDVNPKIANAYQRVNAATAALFDARAALTALLINGDIEHSVPYVAPEKIAR